MAAAPIRPPVWPPAPSDIKPGRNDARVAAQKAFFEAALAGRPAPRPAVQAEPAPATPTATPAQAIRSAAAVEARAMDKLPPPGSIVNILV
ncbi:MAG TPA: hypothetical protein VGG29_10280 [Caulobacteraceae bacterium]|jgi:hypothetical protein